MNTQILDPVDPLVSTAFSLLIVSLLSSTSLEETGPTIRRDQSTYFLWVSIALAILLLVPVPGQAQIEDGEAPRREAVQEALDLYMEGLIAQDAGRIPLATNVIFAEPDGSAETTREGIGEVAPFLERQTVDSIRVHHTLIDGEWGCELTDYFWSDGPKMPIALCLRVRDGKITEIRPYFDRTLFGE